MKSPGSPGSAPVAHRVFRMLWLAGQLVLGSLRDGLYSKLVGDSFMSGVRCGVIGTPTLFIDRIRYDGPRDEETLVAELELVADEATET